MTRITMNSLKRGFVPELTNKKKQCFNINSNFPQEIIINIKTFLFGDCTIDHIISCMKHLDYKLQNTTTLEQLFVIINKNNHSLSLFQITIDLPVLKSIHYIYNNDYSNVTIKKRISVEYTIRRTFQNNEIVSYGNVLYKHGIIPENEPSDNWYYNLSS